MFFISCKLEHHAIHHSVFDKIPNWWFNSIGMSCLQAFLTYGRKIFAGSVGNFEECPAIPEDFRRFLVTFPIFPRDVSQHISQGLSFSLSLEFFSLSLSFSGAGREMYNHFPELLLSCIYFKLIYIFWRCVSSGYNSSHFSYWPHIGLSRGGIKVFDLNRNERW